jgi:hypothetical protein
VYAGTTEIILTDQDILTIATRAYDKNKITKSRLILGRHNNSIVIADYICSDICPDYTVRVIHYDLRNEQKCSDVGGVEKQMLIPVSIASTYKTFCFPKPLTDNWESYKK